MRTRALCTLMAVGLLASTTTALAHPGAALPRAEGRERTMAAAAADLVRAGVPRDRLIAAGLLRADESGSSSVIVVFGPDGGSAIAPVGDLDGNRTKDVLETRYVSGSQPTNLGMYARDGGTGRLLWQRAFRIPRNHFLFALPLRTGSGGQPGVLLCDLAFVHKSAEDNAQVTETSIRLVGLDGRGRQLWTHTESGTTSWGGGGMTLKHAPGMAGIFTGGERRPDSVLLSIADGYRPGSSDGGERPRGTVQPIALDARTGKARALGAAASSDDAFPSVQVVSDGSGDGRADLALIAPGAKPRLEIRRETDANPVWVTTAVALRDGAYVHSAGRLTGAKVGGAAVPDLAVVTEPAPPTSTDEIAAALPVSVLPAPSNEGTVSLLSGADGAVVWSKPGDGVYTVERAGPQLVPALGVTTTDARSDKEKTTTTLTVTTYDAKGTAVYTVTRSASTPTSPDAAAWDGVAWVTEAGHLSGTSAVDGVAVLIVISGDSFEFEQVVFAGRTGKNLPNAHDQPLWASTTGHGDDLASTTVKDGITVTVRRGSDGALRFRRTLPGTEGYAAAEAYGALLQPGRCADVLVNASGSDGRRLSAVLASNGQLRWILTHTDKDLRPGTVRRAPAPHPRCA
ncbi:MAG: hypothetical protein JJD92_15220 [Frankiaceae bacterium]|nr:hypothetical protein [Frankiaceae bacterium]